MLKYGAEETRAFICDCLALLNSKRGRLQKLDIWNKRWCFQ